VPLVLPNVYNKETEQSEELEALTYQSSLPAGGGVRVSVACPDNAWAKLAFGQDS
jgi:hypothetical protein